MTASELAEAPAVSESGRSPLPGTDGAPDPSYRTTARFVGVLYLAGMVVGIGANVLVQSVLTAPGGLATVAASSTLLALGALAWLATAAGDAAHGVLMFPVLKHHSERSAVAYVAARMADSFFIAVMALLIVVQIPIGARFLETGAADTTYLRAAGAVLGQTNLYAYEFAMVTLGVSGLILCSAFRRNGLIPGALAVWGLVGYAVILCGSVLQILGFELYSIHTVPGGLWELFIGVWLLVKGFRASAASGA